MDVLVDAVPEVTAEELFGGGDAPRGLEVLPHDGQLVFQGVIEHRLHVLLGPRRLECVAVCRLSAADVCLPLKLDGPRTNTTSISSF